MCEQADLELDLKNFQYLFMFSKKSQYWHVFGRANRALFLGYPKVRKLWFKSFFIVTTLNGWGDLPHIWVDNTFKGDGKIVLMDEEEKKL